MWHKENIIGHVIDNYFNYDKINNIKQMYQVVIIERIIMLRLKIKRWLKDGLKAFWVYMSLPNVWILLLIIILSAIALILSIMFNDTNNFLCSLFLSIFTGFVTGVVICLISTIKSIWLYKTESKIKWIDEIHTQYMEFNKKYYKLFISKREFDNDKTYDEVYDLLCMGNNISVSISQDRYDKKIPFNPYKYCKNSFGFDAEFVMDSNENIRNSIIYNYYGLSVKELQDLFKKLEKPLFLLNSDLIREKDNLLVKIKHMNTSLL